VLLIPARDVLDMRFQLLGYPAFFISVSESSQNVEQHQVTSIIIIIIFCTLGSIDPEG